ncbi:MAG: glycosyltransferase family 2 protein [Bacteroidales bacterium]|nr:glycosyltransferase family 2 protein [Bacteroidales bacterium]
MSIELSIIILCYRSEEAIIDFADKAKQIAEEISSSYEIILVGNYLDGSDDRTREIVQQIAAGDNCYRCICKQKKGMMGWDMKEGLDAASGKYLCVIDGDGQFPLDSIKRCYHEIISRNYDLVKTFREKRNDGIYRKFISRIYNLIFSILFSNLNSRDINSKPKIISRKAYSTMNLTSDDWFIDAEIMINVRRLKLKFFEFPIEFYKLSGRPSFVKFSAILEFIRNLIIFRIKEFKK